MTDGAPARALLDACVLYPTVLREILLAVARRGLYRPLWSPRIADEWLHVAARDGAAARLLAEGDLALLRADFAGGEVSVDDAAMGGLWLPDPADIHVLAAAIAGRAGTIVTFNTRDFPARELAPHGLRAVHPDNFLMALLAADHATVAAAVGGVLAEAGRRDGAAVPARAFLKRAGLPRLGKAMEGAA